MYTRISLVALLLSVAAGAALADDERSMQTASGQELVIGQHGTWGKHCQGLAPPQVLVTQQPANGTVETRPGDTTLKSLATASQSRTNDACIGSTVPGVHVVYHPKPGFHGTDVVHYTTAYGGSVTIPHVITIVVH